MEGGRQAAQQGIDNTQIGDDKAEEEIPQNGLQQTLDEERIKLHIYVC